MIEEALNHLGFFREQAEALMTDTFKIRRVVGVSVDPLTGEDTPDTVDVYKGPGKLQSFQWYESSKETISHLATVQRMRLDVPVGEYMPLVGDVAECVKSLDANLVGKEFRVVQEIPHKTHATAYRTFVELKAS